jgi:2-polyprenyl-3-methyl-5-hydroxy-6-metoxy-1,4-benzoquinol methylase
MTELEIDESFVLWIDRKRSQLSQSNRRVEQTRRSLRVDPSEQTSMHFLRTLLIAVLASPVALALLVATSFAQSEPPGHHPSPGGPDHGPDHLAHDFDDVEAYARRFDDPARDAWQKPDEVIAALGLGRGMQIADIGAGTGYFAIRLAMAPEAPTVHAVDVAPAMVAHLKSRADREGLKNVVPILAGAGSANLPTPVDLVLVVDTYHHIGDRVAYFRRLLA